MDRFVSIAWIVKKRGVQGEVAAELLTDFPERFSLLDKVHIFNDGKGYWEKLERHWFHKGRIILKFRGRDRPEQIQELIGGEVQIPEDERFALPKDSYYYSDLIGCKVLENGKSLGTVTGIFGTGTAGNNLVVAGPDGREVMVPLVRKFVVGVDVKGKVIHVELPAGLASDL